MTKPNIVFFIPDSYRADVLGHAGNAGAITPNLDAVVDSDAVSYLNNFSQNPVCTPSRCSFMTGLYPHVHGHRSMRNMLKEYEPNLLNVLRRAGYYTWWGGRNDLVAVEKREDYLKYCDLKFNPDGKTGEGLKYRKMQPLEADNPYNGVYYQGVLTPDEAGDPHCDYDTANVLGAVEMIKNYKRNEPFFCYLPLANPHPPYRVEENYYNKIDPQILPPRIPVSPGKASLPELLDALRKEYQSEKVTEDMWREIKRVYYAMCCKVDSLFGNIVDALKEKGIYDNTWIFFFSDHGDFAGDYSLPEKTHATLQDCLLKVPLVIKPAKGVQTKPGTRTQLVELLDITATIYDLLDIEPDYAHQGISLRESLSGNNNEIHDAVFAEVGARKNEAEFLNTEVNTLPSNNFYAKQSRVAIKEHEKGSYSVMCRTQKYKYIRRYYTSQHELFDLTTDPEESENLSGKIEYKEIEQQMATKLLDFFLRTGDILPAKPDLRNI